uniref:Response regulator receiver protein n=1 Tax=Solibacter usitatus (strain Ellin6076) TaxID=234267 RepID=Q02B31_SOLUE
MTNTGEHILVVDDEPTLLKMMSTYLGRLGYKVVPVGSTDKALAEIEAAPERFAIAVLDATMSGISVEDLASRMLAANRRMCVIVASGYPVDMTLLQDAAPRRVIFLHKPFIPEMLAGTVRRMLATQKEAI